MTPASSVWTRPDFLRLWLGQVASGVGSGVSQLATPLLVLALTDSPAAAGLVAAARSAPYLILGLPAGALVDRLDRRLLLIACDLGRTVAMGSVPLAWAFGVLTMGQLVVVALVQGTGQVFANLAQVAALPRVVERAQIPSAQALNASSMAVASLAGPGIGGLIVGAARTTVAGAAFAYLVDAMSYVISVWLLATIRTPLQGPRTAGRRMHTEIVEGLRYLWADRPIRLLAFVNAAHRVVLGPSIVLAIVVFGRDTLRLDAPTIGLVVSAAGAGGILGSAITPALRRHLPVGWHMILVIAFHSLGLAIVAASSTFLVALVGMIVIGAMEAMTSVVQVSYRLATIPDALQGRVNSVYRMGSFSATTLGTALVGILLELSGARPVLWLLAAYVGLVGVATMASAVRRL